MRMRKTVCFSISIKIFILNGMRWISAKLAHTHLWKHKTRAFRFEKIWSSYLFCLFSFVSVKCSSAMHCPSCWHISNRNILDLSHICRLMQSTRVGCFFLLFYLKWCLKNPFNSFATTMNARTNHKGSQQMPIQTYTTGYCFYFFILKATVLFKHAFIIVVNLQRSAFIGHFGNKNQNLLFQIMIVPFCHTSIYENFTFHSKQ